jgi:hypothetical protein
LPGLTHLALSQNALVTDITSLRDLRNLKKVDLGFLSQLANVQPLLQNTGFAAGDSVDLRSTSVACTDVSALRLRGVTVALDPASPCY